jgi:hypothetical protein
LLQPPFIVSICGVGSQDVGGDQHDANCEHSREAEEGGEPNHPVTHGGAPGLSVAASSIDRSHRVIDGPGLVNRAGSWRRESSTSTSSKKLMANPVAR